MQNHHRFRFPNKAGTHDSHGAPLGDAEIALTREQLGWKYAPFEIPSEIYAQWDAKEARRKNLHGMRSLRLTRKLIRRKQAEFTRRMKGEMPSDFNDQSERVYR